LHEELSLLGFVINNNYYIFSHFIQALTPTAAHPSSLPQYGLLFFCRGKQRLGLFVSVGSTCSFWGGEEKVGELLRSILSANGRTSSRHMEDLINIIISWERQAGVLDRS
jgi:hypothetical protein